MAAETPKRQRPVRVMKVHDAFRAGSGPHPAMTYRLPPALRRIKWSVRIAAVAAAVIGLYAALWFGGALILRSSVEDWMEARRAEGLSVGVQVMEIGGFPFHLTLRLERPTIGSSKGAPTHWAWEGQRVLAEARPWSPLTLKADLGNRHGFLVGNGTAPLAYALTAASATAELVLAFDGSWPERARIALEGARLSGTGMMPVSAEAATAGLTRLDPDERNAPFLDLAAELRGLRLPDSLNLPLGGTMQSVDLAATVLGELPPPPWAPALTAWRDAGGNVQVRRFELDYGTLAVWAGGTLALDADLQPIGTATAKVTGFVETIDTLRATGIVQPRDAVTAMMVLGALAKTDPGGGPATLNLPWYCRTAASMPGRCR